MSAIDFSNKVLVSENIPAIEDMGSEPLSEKYAPINRLSTLIVTLLVLLIISTLYWQSLVPLSEKVRFMLPYIIGGVGILGLLQVLYSSYGDLKKTLSQPIARIQHIELKRGPIERQVGLATLQVFSAGGSTHTFEIPGLPVDVAQKLRHFILQHKDIARHG
jgi:membrane protein YdbS with pleckstrin-like domain